MEDLREQARVQAAGREHADSQSTANEDRQPIGDILKKVRHLERTKY
jgi:hypothetical protein